MGWVDVVKIALVDFVGVLNVVVWCVMELSGDVYVWVGGGSNNYVWVIVLVGWRSYYGLELDEDGISWGRIVSVVWLDTVV